VSILVLLNEVGALRGCGLCNVSVDGSIPLKACIVWCQIVAHQSPAVSIP